MSNLVMQTSDGSCFRIWVQRQMDDPATLWPVLVPASSYSAVNRFLRRDRTTRLSSTFSTRVRPSLPFSLLPPADRQVVRTVLDYTQNTSVTPTLIDLPARKHKSRRGCPVNAPCPPWQWAQAMNAPCPRRMVRECDLSMVRRCNRLLLRRAHQDQDQDQDQSLQDRDSPTRRQGRGLYDRRAILIQRGTWPMSAVVGLRAMLRARRPMVAVCARGLCPRPSNNSKRPYALRVPHPPLLRLRATSPQLRYNEQCPPPH